jgi:putative redox protein
LFIILYSKEKSILEKEGVMHRVTTSWQSKMSFDADLDGHHIVMDSASEFGGEEKGPRPKQILLAAVGGCTGMDVVSLLKKMRVEYEGLSITAQGEVSSEHPKVYTSIHLIYEFRRRGLPEDKLRKAVDLSQERYCSVSAMLRQAATLTYEIKIVG